MPRTPSDDPPGDGHSSDEAERTESFASVHHLHPDPVEPGSLGHLLQRSEPDPPPTVALPAPSPLLRAALVLLAVGQLVLVLPWLIGEDPWELMGASDAHLTRDGALSLAVIAAALMVAYRPRWAQPGFILASVALLALTVAGIVDDEPAAATARGEFVHFPAIVLTCLIGISGIRLRPLRPIQRS